MILTYKRKGTSLNTCSFYERLCCDSLAECSSRSTNIEDRLPNGCCSPSENKKAKFEEWPERKLPSKNNFYQSQSSASLDAPLIKFKYTRRPKELRKSGGSLQRVAVLPLIQAENQSVSKIDTTKIEFDRLHCDPCSLNHCGSDAMRPYGSVPSQNFRREENHLDPDCSNISVNGSTTSVLNIIDPLGTDTEDSSSLKNRVELGETKCAAPLQTYKRRSRNNEDFHRTYAALMAERNTFLVHDQSFSKNAENPVHQAVVKTTELSESEIVEENSLLFCQSLGKPTYRVSSVGNMRCSQENQKVRNGCPLFDDTYVSILSLNDEDTIKSHHSICGLSLHTVSEEHPTDTVMADASEAIIANSQNHSDDPEKVEAASNDSSGCVVRLNCSVLEVPYSDKRSEVDVNLAASTECDEVVPFQSGEFQAASVHAEVPKDNSKELLGTINEAIKESVGLFDINVNPSKDIVCTSPKNKMADLIASPYDSTRTKVLQLFPEDATVNAFRHNTSKSEMVPAISPNTASVTVALPELSVSREIIQDKVAQSSSNQARHKLLMDSFRSSNRPQMEVSESFHQKFHPFVSVWCEEELDNLWVGVRRHGKDWYAMLRDPRLPFAPWRTARDLDEKWIMEQTKLLGSTPGTPDQPSNPAGIPLDSYRSSVLPFMPPGPGFMTRFLTDPMQLSLSNYHLNKQGQGMFPPKAPHNSNDVPGNGTRLFNRRGRARRKSQHKDSTWGRFKVGNQVMPPPRLPTSLANASTSRISILPSYIRDALHYPHPLPPLPVPLLSAQHLSNRSPFHDHLNYNAIGSSSQNSFHLTNPITDWPTIAAFPETQQNQTQSTDPKRGKESINLETDASSEGTISDDDNPRLASK